jgi:hypothetical protein
MHNCQSKDQFGVNYNWNYVLLQTRENCEDFEEVRIKLTLEDVDSLIESLMYYKERVAKWKEAVGLQKPEETESEYNLRIITTARDNNYFIGKQED